MTDDSWRDIRPIAVGVATRGDELLLSELHDPEADETFYRPPGGAMAFGESSDEALEREFAEELGVTIAERSLVETLERTFTFRGQMGHEIWFLYAVAFEESWPYEREAFTGVEDDGESFRVVWRERSALADETVYPEELPDLLARGSGVP
ncbi:MAG: NUDIX hydrolase [Halobacteriales archaeon]